MSGYLKIPTSPLVSDYEIYRDACEVSNRYRYLDPAELVKIVDRADQLLQQDLQAMLDALRDTRIYGPYAMTYVDESGEVVHYLIDEDGNLIDDEST